MNENRNILITGATGFIGRCLLKRLLDAEKVSLNIITRNKNHNLPHDKRINVFVGDFTDAGLFKKALDGCDRIFHLAAKISFSPKDKEEVFRINTRGTEKIINIAKESGVKRLVFISSAITIGLSCSKDCVLDERNFAQGIDVKRNIYLKSKLEAEKIILDGSNSYVETVILNPSTIFGEGDDSLNSGSLIRMVADSRFLPVPCGGTSVVDVEDIVEGIMLAMEKGKNRNRYILTNENLTFFNLYKVISEVLGRRPCFIRLPKFSKTPLKYIVYLQNSLKGLFGSKDWLITPQIIEDTFYFKYYSNKKAREELGWAPRIKFEDSVKKAWQYYFKNGLLG